MKRVLVRYKIKPDQVELNESLVRAVYEELQRVQPDGFRYATFKLPDGVSFVHVASVENADGRAPLPDLDSFKAFQAGMGARCDEPPVVADVDEIGSYRFFGD